MKKLNLITLFIIGLLIASCSKDNDDTPIKPKYIKEATYTNMSTPFINSFAYNQGLFEYYE